MALEEAGEVDFVSFPTLVSLADDLTAGDADERFEFALELLVRGLEAMARES